MKFVLSLFIALGVILTPLTARAAVLDIRVPVLTYHDLSDIPHDPWSGSSTQFQNEMNFLYINGYHTITPDQLYEALYHGGPLPQHPVLITFDDGYRSVQSVAEPILKRYGFHATLFMIADFANGKHDFLTWADLKQMVSSGVFTIESHTLTHPHLAKIPIQEALHQLTASKQELEQHLGTPVDYFCYPYNSYDWSVLYAVQRAGYKMAFSSNVGFATPYQNRYLIHRLDVHESLSLQTFATRLQHWDYALHHMWITVNGKSVASPDSFVLDKTAYEPIWYVMHTLDQVGIQSQWNGRDWQITVHNQTAGPNPPSTPAALQGTGTDAIYLNGTETQRFFAIPYLDPATHRSTTYVPIWYVDRLLQELHISVHWDGSHWRLQDPRISAVT